MTANVGYRNLFAAGENLVPAFVDSGQGAAGRIASWMAWNADPNPLPAPEQTNILRMDDNGALAGPPVLALGTGGCGTWGPVLDGSSNGATSGGDNCFFVTPQPQSSPYLLDDFGNPVLDDEGRPVVVT